MRHRPLSVIAAIALALAPIRAPAQSVPFSSSSSCPSPTSDGAIITAPTTCTLSAQGSTWAFGGAAGNGNYALTAFSSLISVAINAELKSSAVYWQTKFPTCGTVWRTWVYNYDKWASGPGTLLTGSFSDTTKGTQYASWADLSQNISNGDTVSISQQPIAYGFNCWPEVVGISKNNITANIAAGTKFGDPQSITSTGLLVIDGSSVTVNGGDFNGPVRIHDNAVNPKLENMTVHNGCGLIGTTCVLSGNNNGVVTLTNVTVHDGGDSSHPGQDHNVYISASVAGDSAASAQMTNLSSYDVTNGGWTLKMRPEGINTQNHVTQSYIFCTKIGGGCEQNGVVDMPCAGNFLIDFSVMERGPGGDNGYIIRAGEELRNGTTQCPATYASVNNVTLDHDILIWDGPSPGWAVTNAVCIGGHDGSGNCETSSIPPGQTCTITNSVMVGDSASGITLIRGGGCTDGGGNRVYANRAAAAAGEGWSGPDWHGNPCCAFPWRPMHP